MVMMLLFTVHCYEIVSFEGQLCLANDHTGDEDNLERCVKDEVIGLLVGIDYVVEAHRIRLVVQRNPWCQ